MDNKRSSQSSARLWLDQRLAALGETKSSMAAKTSISVDKISKMLSGVRGMPAEEKTAIAIFLQVTPDEVEQHMGKNKDPSGLPVAILLTSTIDRDGRIASIREPRSLPPSIVERAQAMVGENTQHVIAAQIRAADGLLAFLDDAVLLYRYSNSVEYGAGHGLSICRTKTEKPMLARIESARKTGEAKIRTVDGDVREVDLISATPVLAIIP